MMLRKELNMFENLVEKLRALDIDPVFSMKETENNKVLVVASLQDTKLKKVLSRAYGGDVEEALSNALVQVVGERAQEIKLIQSLS
jgi:hypothetical protein